MKEFIEKLIGRLEEKSFFMQVGEFKQDQFINTGIAKEIINQLAEEYNQEKPTKTNKNQEWIPTSERLPEKNAIVLTCDKDGWISVKVNMPYAGVKNDFECGYYTAWMPLPEPYKQEE